jgi:hypothetical protein
MLTHTDRRTAPSRSPHHPRLRTRPRLEALEARELLAGATSAVIDSASTMTKLHARLPVAVQPMLLAPSTPKGTSVRATSQAAQNLALVSYGQPTVLSAVWTVNGNPKETTPIQQNLSTMSSPALFLFFANGVFAYVPSKVPGVTTAGNIYDSTMFPVFGTYQVDKVHGLFFQGRSNSRVQGGAAFAMYGTSTVVNGVYYLVVHQSGSMMNAWANSNHLQDMVYAVPVQAVNF